MTRPGSPTAFEQLVDDYDAARPRYPDALYDALPPLPGRSALELGAGTGIATTGLLARGAEVVCTDLGPRMLGRLHAQLPAVPALVARAEALPFADGSFDLVAGAQMWHWVDVPVASREVARVLRPGGWLALWWNEADAVGLPWWEAQQDRLEGLNDRYSRHFRDRDYHAELAGLGFGAFERRSFSWRRALDWPMYERWLRSKSYVQELTDVEAFVSAERASMGAAFPDGVIVEPFTAQLWLARRLALT